MTNPHHPTSAACILSVKASDSICQRWAAALDVVAREGPALVVLDVMLSKLDGFEVCRRLRASNSPLLF